MTPSKVLAKIPAVGSVWPASLSQGVRKFMFHCAHRAALQLL
jgi:hypothetical protein